MVRLVIKSPLATWLSLATYEHSQGLNKPLFSVSAEPRSSGIAMAEWGSVGQIYMKSCLKFILPHLKCGLETCHFTKKKKRALCSRGDILVQPGASV